MFFGIELYGIGSDGESAGPGRVTFGGDNIDDAISQAEPLIQQNTFLLGKAIWFKIYDNDRQIAYDSRTP
ncbi:MAG: hypothetical protein ACREC0_01710 [Methylocella sp.]